VQREAEHTPHWMPLLLAHRAQAWLALGQPARAHQDLDRAAALLDGAPPMAHVKVWLLRAQLATMLHQPSAHAAVDTALLHLGAAARPLSRHRAALVRCTLIDPADALAAAGDVLDWALQSGRAGIIVAARTRLAQAALALGHSAEAARQARHLAALEPDDGTDDVYRGEVWLAAVRGLAASEPALADSVLMKALRWLDQTEREHVPEAFRHGFRHAQPTNRELAAAAARAGF